jgi:tetratricopeptide (TPR) repeat protein
MKKPTSKQIIYSLVIAVLLGGIIAAYIFTRKNHYAQISKLKSKGKHEYRMKQFGEATATYHHLIDSFQVKEEAVRINYANAGFLSIMNTMGFGIEGMMEKMQGKDSATFKRDMKETMKYADSSLLEYETLRSASNKVIASMANNQAGVAIIKQSSLIFDESNLKMADSLMKESIIYFKDALKKDPTNDSARYNLELLKYKLNFPEIMLVKAERLVAQRRYAEAYHIMEEAMKKDARMQKYEDYKKKVYSISQIDSLQRI